MQKILLSLLTVGLVASVAFGATRAYFSDSETSTGNTFAAGTINLKVDDKEGTEVVHLTRIGLKPYAPWSHSNGGQWILKNTGNLPGRFSVTIKNIKNLENSCGTPEVVAGDTTCGLGTDQGELGSLMYGKWMENHWGVYTPAKGWIGSSLFNPLNTAEGVVVDGLVLNPDDVISAYLDLEWDTHAGTQDNLGQGDGLEFDIEFKLNQI